MTFRLLGRSLLLVSILLLTSHDLRSNEQESDYVLDAGDQISIVVYGEPDLTIKTRIGKSGIIAYPFLGDIQAIGLTPKQLEKEIDKGLRGPYLVDPAVNVSVEIYRPFFISGEVKRPGSYPYQPGLTLNKAITLAAGLTERASSTKWTIIRKTANGEVEIPATIDTLVKPDDIITIKQSFF